jgi:NHLM bacteriocin system ABC transporter ATP-binding protein
MATFPVTGRAWRIETGCVDVFFELPSARGEGARRFLFRIEAGEAIFGFPRECPLVAVPINGASYSDARWEDAVRCLDVWIHRVTLAITPARPPANCIALEPGVETDSSISPVSPLSGVVWTRVIQGEAWFAGNRELPGLAAGQPFPLSSDGWLQPVEPARFAASRDFAWSDFDAFQSLALHCLQAIADQEDAAERERAQLRKRFDAERMERALRDLAAPLDPKARLGIRRPSNPWFAACQAVGETIGIEFAAPHNQASVSRKSVRDLAEAARARYRYVLLQGEWWKGEHGALLAIRESDRAPLALLPDGNRYRCFDPSTGRREPVTAKLAAQLEPYATSFYPPFRSGDIGLSGLMMFGLRGVKRELGLILAAGVGASITALATPLATSYIFDTLIPGAQRADIGTICLLLLVAALSGAAFGLLRGVALLRLEGKMDVSMQSALWIRLLELPPAFFRNYSAGDLANRGLGIQSIRQVLTGSAVTAILSGIFSLSSLALLFHFSSSLALVGLVLALVPPIVVVLGGRLQIRRQREMAEVRGKLYGLLLQIIGGVAKIRVSAAESRAFSVWATRFAALRTISVRSRLLTNRMTVFQQAWPSLCSIVLFSYYLSSVAASPVSGVKGAAITTGAFVGFLAAFTQLLTGTLGLVTALNSLASVAPAYERLRPILEAEPETSGNRSQPGELTGHIEVRHVSFRYSADSPMILKDVTITIRPGEFVAIVGPSGSGKSTLFRMLLGFESPDSGSVCYDQHDLAHLDPASVRRQIGVVLQNGKIRAGSIFENIVGASQLNLDTAWEAARMAGLAADIETFPMGMHTMLSEGGGTLSGGQRQRLIIARALVRRPRIVLFDEATSALDNRTQALVSRSLENLRATRVVIAHRLSTIEKADCIYVLEKGQLVEKGSYAELMARNGTFAALAKRQIT